jgi:hypothetical protein
MVSGSADRWLHERNVTMSTRNPESLLAYVTVATSEDLINLVMILADLVVTAPHVEINGVAFLAWQTEPVINNPLFLDSVLQ